MRLAEKVALITGGGRGIGRACVDLFAQEGARVVIAQRDAATGEAARDALSSRGHSCLFVPTDVSEPESVKRVVDAAMETYGRIDILYNNAGGSTLQDGPVTTAPFEEFWLKMKVDLFGTWLGCHYVIPHMIAAGGGSVINLSSLAGIKAFPGHGIYGTSKAALIELSQVMAMELASDNIRVNVICPAHVEGTELHIATVGKENIGKRSELMASLHPLGRNGKPEDIANAALFLASDQSSWLTGIVLNADGGRSLETNRTPSVFSVSKIPS